MREALVDTLTSIKGLWRGHRIRSFAAAGRRRELSVTGLVVGTVIALALGAYISLGHDSSSRM